MTPLHAHMQTSEEIMKEFSACCYKQQQFEERKKASNEILQILVDAKAEVDAADSQGMTALHCLVECGTKHRYCSYLDE